MRSVRHRVAGAGEALVLWIQYGRPLRGILAGRLQFRARLQLPHILEHLGNYCSSFNTASDASAPSKPNPVPEPSN